MAPASASNSSDEPGTAAAPTHYAYPAVPPYMPFPPAYAHYEYAYEYDYRQYHQVAGQYYLHPQQHASAPAHMPTTAAEASPPEPPQPTPIKTEMTAEPTLTPGPVPSQPPSTAEAVAVEDEIDDICPVCDSECTCGTRGVATVVVASSTTTPKPSSTATTTPTPGSFGVFSVRKDAKGGLGVQSGAAASGIEPNGTVVKPKPGKNGVVANASASSDAAQPAVGEVPVPTRPTIKIKIKPLSIPPTLLPPPSIVTPTPANTAAEKKKRGRPTKAVVAARKEEEARQRAAAERRDRVGRAAAAAAVAAALLEETDEDSSLTELEEAEGGGGADTPRARRDSGESNESSAFPTFVSAFTSSTASEDTTSSTDGEERTEMGEDTELEAEEERAIVREHERRQRLERGEGKRRRWAWQKERKDRERRGETAAADGEADGVAADGSDDGEDDEEEEEDEEDDGFGGRLGLSARVPSRLDAAEHDGHHTPTSGTDEDEEDEEDRFFAHLSDFSEFSDSFWGSGESGSEDGSSSEETDYEDDDAEEEDPEDDLKKPDPVASASLAESDGVEKGTESDAVSTLSEISLAEAKASGLYDVAEDDARSPFLKPRKSKPKKSPKNKGKSRADHHPKSKEKERAKSELRRQRRRKHSARMPKMLLVEDGDGRLVFGGEWEMEDVEDALEDIVKGADPSDGEVELMELFRSEDEKDGAEADVEMEVDVKPGMSLGEPFSADISHHSFESESSSEWTGDGETTDEDDVPGLRPAEAEVMMELGLGLGLPPAAVGEIEVVDPLVLNPVSLSAPADEGTAGQQGAVGYPSYPYPYAYPYLPYAYDFPPPPPPAPLLVPAPPAPAAVPAPAPPARAVRPVRPLPSRARAGQPRLPTMAVWTATATAPSTPETGTAMVVVVDGTDASGISPFAKIRKGDGLDAWAGGGVKRRRESSARSDASWYYSNSKRARHDEPPSSESAMTGPLPTRDLSPSPDPLQIDDLLDTSYFLYDESIPSSAAEDEDEEDTGDAAIMKHLTRFDHVPLGQWFRRARAQGAEVGMEMGLSVTAFAVDHEGDDTLLGPPDFSSGGRNLVVVSPIIFPSRDGYVHQRSPSPVTLGDSFSLAAALSPLKAGAASHGDPRNKNSRKEKRREKKRERMAMGIDVTPKVRKHRAGGEKGKRRLGAF